MDIKGAVALVTGANRGIGRAIVERLLTEGATRVYAGMRTPRELEGLPGVIPVRLDVTDERTIQEAARRHPDINVLVNNAGVSLGQPLVGASSQEAAEREMQVNYFGTLRMCRAFAPVLARNGGGAIVNVLSILARINMPTIGSYSASKAAALSLTQGVRAELAKQGTLVMAVLPAFVDTEMARGVAGPKMSPEALAETLVAALRDGLEEVYPGQAATALAAQLQQDAKAVERRFAAMVSPR
jgi:NAD(P)-dependent dehydrogenase (short-subunit alcohol dehydrogenase family)